MLDIRLFEILRARAWDTPDLDALLEALSRRSLRDRVGFVGAMLRILDAESTRIATKRLALTCLSGARGMLAMEAFTAALSQEGLADLAVAELARAGARDGAFFAHAAFHPDVEVRRLAVLHAPTPKAAEHFLLYLLADDGVRALARERIAFDKMRITAKVVPTLLELVRSGGLARSDAATLLSSETNLQKVLDWAGESPARPVEIATRIQQDQRIVAPGPSNAYDPLDELLGALAEQPAARILFARLAITVGMPRLVASASIVLHDRPDALPLVVTLFGHRYQTVLTEGIPIPTRLAALAALPDLGAVRVHGTHLQKVVAEVLAWGGDLRHVAGVCTYAYDGPFALASSAFGGVDALARRIVADPESARGLFALHEPIEGTRSALVAAILALREAAIPGDVVHAGADRALALLVERIPIGQIAAIATTDAFVAEVLPLATADLPRRRAFAEALVAAGGATAVRDLIDRLASRGRGAKPARDAWLGTIVETAAKKLECPVFVAATTTLSAPALRALLLELEPPILLPLGAEILLAHTLASSIEDPELRAWAESRIPVPPSDEAPPPAARAFAGVAFRTPPPVPDVTACVELLGSFDPVEDTDRAFRAWGSDDPRFLAELDGALVAAYAYGQHTLSPLAHAWLWRWDAHALIHLDDALARHGSLAGCARARAALTTPSFRRASLEAIGSAIALLAYRDRPRLLEILRDDLVDLLVDLLADAHTEAGAAAALRAIVSARVLDVRDAHGRVRLLLPSLGAEARVLLGDWITSEGLPPRRVARAALAPTAAEVLERVRSTPDPAILERFLDDERLDVVHEATLRLIEVGEAGVRRLVARIESARDHASVAPIVESIALWPDGPSALRAFALSGEAARSPELRFRLALAACERKTSGAPERALALTGLGDPIGWFGDGDHATLAALPLPEADRLATLATSPHPHAYLPAVEALLAAPPSEPARAALRAFLHTGTERLVSLRRRVALHLHVQGDLTGFPLVVASCSDEAPKPSPLFVGVPDAGVVDATMSLLAVGHEVANEKLLVRQLVERGVPILGQEEALELVLDKAIKDGARLAAAKALTRADLRERKLQRVARVFAWGTRVGRRLLGKPMRVRMTGAQKLGYTRLRDNVVFVTPLPILRGDRHAEELVEALVLHELGHHAYHAGEAGLAVWKRAQDEKLHGLLNLVADEHLERNLRAVNPDFGDRLKRLAAYAFQHTGRDLQIDPLLGYLGPHAVRVLAGLSLGVSRHQGQVMVRSGRLLFGMEHDGLSFSRFVRALRMGLGNRHADPKVAAALALFAPKDGVEFKHLDMEGLWIIVRKLREIFGWETDLAEDIGGHEALDDADGDVFGDGISQDDVDREVQRIENPDKDGGSAGTPGGRPWLNVSSVETFDKIKRVVRLVHDPARHAPYARAVSRPAAAMRAFFERLGLASTPSRMRLTGNRVDGPRLRSLVLRGDPRVLVARETAYKTDLFIGVCVDCSGSMTTRNNIERAKHFGVLLAEAVRPLERSVDLRLFGFTDDVIFDCGSASRCAAHDLHTAGGNNDAAALYHAATIAKASRRKAKLLVMISDGLPTQCSVASLKGLVKYLGRKEGMVVAQIAVQPIAEVCFPHYVVITEDGIDATVKKFGGIISRLVERAITSS